MKTLLKLFIADDHQLFSEAVKKLLQNTNNMEVIGEATDGNTTLEKLQQLEPVKPDIILMDIGMPGINGIECTQQITWKYPTVKVIALTRYSDDINIANMLQAGAKGYVIKHANTEELLQAIKTVAGGGMHFPLHRLAIAMKEIKSENKTPVLTIREIQVVKLVAQTLSNKQIAEELFLSELTVNTHRKNAMRKLGVKNTAGLVKFALNNKLDDL